MKEIILSKPYSFGPYSKCNKKEQWIRITEGCPNQCSYCAEPKEIKLFKIPKIRRNSVKIMDMNLLCKPESKDIIKFLGSQRVNNKVVYYELICGIDFRFLTEELAKLLKKNRFKNIRLAWDYGLDQQYKIKEALKLLLKAGYKPNTIMIFMICNWKINYKTNLKKLELMKIWNVKVGDCWFDNQLSPKIKPVYWKKKEIKNFRRKCRTHNILIQFKIYPSTTKCY